jgi:hypothetical protein
MRVDVDFSVHCDKCSAKASLWTSEVLVTTYLADNLPDVIAKLPPGWITVGDKLYCDAHVVHIT